MPKSVAWASDSLLNIIPDVSHDKSGKASLNDFRDKIGNYHFKVMKHVMNILLSLRICVVK